MLNNSSFHRQLLLWFNKAKYRSLHLLIIKTVGSILNKEKDVQLNQLKYAKNHHSMTLKKD